MVVNLLELIQSKKILIFLFKLAKYKITLLNQPKKLTEESTKKSLINELSNKLLRLEFKSNKNTKNKDAKMIKTKNGRLALSSKYVVCGSKKLRFMKEQEVEGLLSNLGIKTPLNKIFVLINLLIK